MLKQLQSAMDWWFSNLYQGLPLGLRRLFCRAKPRLGLSLQQQQLSLVWNQDGKQQDLGIYRLDNTFDLNVALKKKRSRQSYLLELMLNEHQALRLQHAFPEAVQDNLQQVVSYQLDRLTPFNADAVYFAAELASHDKQRHEVLSDIYIAPVTMVEQLSAKIRSIGLPAFDIYSANDGRVLLQRGLSTQHPPIAQRSSRLPLYFFITTLSLALALPILYQQRRIGQIEAALAEVRQGASSQLEIRERLLSADDALRFLQSRRQEIPFMLEVLDQLTQLLPTHTWVEHLEINGRDLQLRGESSAALSLIDLLENSPHFTQVNFRSPITRAHHSDKDRFHLQAMIVIKRETP